MPFEAIIGRRENLIVTAMPVDCKNCTQRCKAARILPSKSSVVNKEQVAQKAILAGMGYCSALAKAKSNN
jgi:hypothetical protein